MVLRMENVMPRQFCLALVAISGFFCGCGGSSTSQPETSHDHVAAKERFPKAPAMLRTAEAVDADGGESGSNVIRPISGSRPGASDAPKAPEPVALSPEAVAAFDRLVKSYRNEDPDAWMAADAELQKLGKEATPVLAKGLRSADTFTRELAAMTLARMGTDAEGALEELIAVMKKDDSSMARANAASAVSLFPDRSADVLPVLREFLDDSGPSLRKLAIYSLGNVGPKAASEVPRLVKLLSSDDPEVRAAVALALGNIGPTAKGAVSDLEGRTSDESEAVQIAARDAIRKITAPPEEPKPAAVSQKPTLKSADGTKEKPGLQDAETPSVPDPADAKESKPTQPEKSDDSEPAPKKSTEDSADGPKLPKPADGN